MKAMRERERRRKGNQRKEMSAEISSKAEAEVVLV